MITPQVSRIVIRRCRERGIPCVVDPKKADFAVYTRATVVTPNLLEAERAVGQPLEGDEAVARAADELRAALELDAMLITRGPEGMSLSVPEGVTHIPAQIRDVADVTGAGDTVVAVLAACLGRAGPCPKPAGSRISPPGSRSATQELTWSTPPSSRWLGGSVAQDPEPGSGAMELADARRRGRKVVFTNGCFDILHAGHLTCLEGAKRLGDLLVVGLNSDASVRGLKGDSPGDFPGKPGQPPGRAGLRGPWSSFSTIPP